MKEFLKLHKLNKGDKVAIISPSNGLPEIFPEVYELGIKRLREDFGLIPKEYPTTRKMNSTLEDRARDIMAAFTDRANKAVFTSIGGEDQILLIKYLDTELIKMHPKPFIGFSDNTHLHNLLWSLGIPSYYGGAIMTQFGMQQKMDEITSNSIKKALFEGGEYTVNPSEHYNDIGLDWNDTTKLNEARVYEENDGHFWDGHYSAKGILWGGCVESLLYQSTVNKYLPTSEDLENSVLFIETAEDIPEAWIVEYLLNGFGERGWFDKFKAVLVGRPKAWEFDKPKNAEQKAVYRNEQRKAVIRSVRRYNTEIPIIQNLDFGHTDPQILIPYGGKVEIESPTKTIRLFY
jgi:muramoyltetrapeptide carboxypeptidase LdcA involved in peptidoglycan recycling